MTKLLLILMVGMSGCGKEVKVWKKEYFKDKMKEEYQYYYHPETNRRIKDGWYNSYQENGEYNEIGRYKEDVKDEEWVYLADDGKETKGIYKDGNKWSGEFWISVKHDTLGSWIETNDETWDEDKIFGEGKGFGITGVGR